ncbi:MAG: alpha/beta hydrolase [Gammaproteobacteria bacterium]|nr:alpha/beta hydrolase [Gammaproteobacteria bacterium]
MLGTLLVVVGATYAAYRLAPEPMFNLAIKAQRRAAGLTLKEVTVDEHRVPYLEGGQGETLLLLHGFGADKDNWTPIARFLTPHYRVIVPDLPGFGDSSQRNEASYKLDPQLDRIAEFARAVGVTRCHVGGNSMGAYFAAMLAARSPELVQSLWLLAPAGAAGAEPSELLELVGQGDNLLLIDSETKGKRLASLIFTKAPFVPKEFQKLWLQRAIRHCAFNTKIFQELFSDPVLLDARVSGLATPTFIVWGDDDRILHVSGAHALKKLIPNAKLRVMPAMGHCPMLERPRETAADFLSFHQRGL